MINFAKRLMIHAAILGGALAATNQLGCGVEMPTDASIIQMREETKRAGGFSKDEISEYGHLAALSYTGAENTQEGEALIRSMERQGWTVIEFFSPAERSGLVFCRGKEIVVSYHGTESLRNWATDFYATKSTIGWAPGSAHTGFLNGFGKTWSDVEGLIKQQATKQGLPVSALSITVTGHSLGGALAALATYYLQNVHNVRAVSMITYAAPRVFDTAAASSFKARRALRVVKRNYDPVPHVGPGFLGFVHTGNLLELESDESWVPHLMGGYHPAINKLDMDKVSNDLMTSMMFEPMPLSTEAAAAA